MGWSAYSNHSSFLCGVCTSILTWSKCFIWKWRMFFFIYLFPGFLSEFAGESDFKCCGDLYAVDAVLKTEGSTHLSMSCKPLSGGSVLLPALRWCLPITVTHTCTDSWIFKSPFCLLEVSFTVYILRISDNWRKSKLKNLWDDSSCNIFFPFCSDQTAVKLLRLSYFLNDASYSWLAVVLSLFSSLELCGAPAQLLKQLFLSRTHLSSLDVIVTATSFCSWGFSM